MDSQDPKDQQVEEIEKEVERQERRESWPKPPSLWWCLFGDATLEELEELEIELFGEATDLDGFIEP